MMIRGVIFDMDGLLTDTEPVYYDIFNQILGEYGYSMTMQEYTQNICGRADMENFAYLIENYDLPIEIQDLAAKEAVIERNRIEQGVPLKKGVHVILSFLKENDIRIGLATSNLKEKAELILHAHGIYDFFETLVYVDEVGRGKPAPDVFLEAVRRLNLPKEDCLVLEDSVSGVQAAVNGNIPVIMVPDLKQPDEQIRSICTAVRKDLIEVRDYIANVK